MTVTPTPIPTATPTVEPAPAPPATQEAQPAPQQQAPQESSQEQQIPSDWPSLDYPKDINGNPLIPDPDMGHMYEYPTPSATP